MDRRARLDATNRHWVKESGLTPLMADRISHHLFGAPFQTAVDRIHSAHMMPWGNTKHGLRREVRRMLQSEHVVRSVEHLFDD